MNNDPPKSKEEKREALLQKAEKKRRAVSEEIHIDDDFGTLATTYNAVSGTVVASLQRRSEEVFERKIFYRHSTERAYRPVEPLGEIPSLLRDELISSPTCPVIYYRNS